jgi:hypothetical protein
MQERKGRERKEREEKGRKRKKERKQGRERSQMRGGLRALWWIVGVVGAARGGLWWVVGGVVGCAVVVGCGRLWAAWVRFSTLALSLGARRRARTPVVLLFFLFSSVFLLFS